MELAVLNTQGNETGRKVVLSDAVFGVEANDHAIYLDVKQYLADQRQGTHKAKQRNEVAGSTRKLKRQKGTGGARAGSILSPLFPGGGRVFGPVPRDYSFKLKHAVGFLQEGAKVKAYVFFKGRSILFKEQGEVLLLRFANDLEEYGKVEQMPVLEGKRMIIMISPKKK